MEVAPFLLCHSTFLFFHGFPQDVLSKGRAHSQSSVHNFWMRGSWIPSPPAKRFRDGIHNSRRRDSSESPWLQSYYKHTPLVVTDHTNYPARSCSIDEGIVPEIG